MCAFLGATISGCWRTNTTVPLVDANVLEIKGEIPIKIWRVVGPFDTSGSTGKPRNSATVSGQNGRNSDFMLQFGLPESVMDSRALERIHFIQGMDKRFANHDISANGTSNILTLGSAKNTMLNTSHYIASEIESNTEKDIVLAVGVTGSIQMWLNHDLLIEDSVATRRHVDKFQHIVGAHLRKGRNFLFAKLSYMDDWNRVEIMASLFSRLEAKKLVNANGNNPVLLGSIVSAKDKLNVRTDLFSRGTMAKLSLLDSDGKVVRELSAGVGSRVTQIALEGLDENRLYHCVVSDGHDELDSQFYYGDVAKGFGEVLQEVSHIAENRKRDKLLAQVERLTSLMPPQVRAMERWDEMFVASLSELKQNIRDLRKGEEAFDSATGTHLRSYVSSVDDQRQYYWMHVPPSRTNTKGAIPLVLILPFDVSNNTQFPRSYFVNAANYQERYSAMADKYQYIISEIWGRGNGHAGTAIEAADVFDVIRAISAFYPIDQSRIYLMGYCEGGLRALLLAEHYPNVFAAVAVDHPITNPAFAEAVRERLLSPLSGISKLRGTSILISHDIDEPAPRFSNSVDFLNTAQDNHISIVLSKKQGGGGIHGFSQDPAKDIDSFFSFFQGKSLRGSRLSADLSERNGRVPDGRMMPLEVVFGQPILLVRGTGGSASSLKTESYLEQWFENSWMRTYFVNAPRKNDVDVTESDIRGKNLILVGEIANTSILKGIAAGLPLRSMNMAIEIDGKRILGNKLSYIYSVKNPVVTTRSIVVIGSNAELSQPFRTDFVPSRDGFYQYYVFDCRHDSAVPFEFGYLRRVSAKARSSAGPRAY